MKVCIRCKQLPQRGSGSYCKVCHNEYQKAYYKKNPASIQASARRRKAELVKLIREAKNKPCSDCGAQYPWFVMDFDHVHGEKEFNIAVAANKTYNQARIEREITKCEVVCSNCHRIRTFTRLGHSPVV